MNWVSTVPLDCANSAVVLHIHKAYILLLSYRTIWLPAHDKMLITRHLHTHKVRTVRAIPAKITIGDIELLLLSVCFRSACCFWSPGWFGVRSCVFCGAVAPSSCLPPACSQRVARSIASRASGAIEAMSELPSRGSSSEAI